MKNGSLIGSCDRKKGNDHRDKIFGPRIHFFIVFFIFLQTFFCQGQFFFANFFCCSNFSSFSSRGNKQILVSLGRVQYCFFVPQVELCCPLGEFLSFGTALMSFSGSQGPSLRTKILLRDNKAQPSGQKQYCTLPRDTKICLFPLEKKRKN